MKKFNINICTMDANFNTNAHIWAEDIYEAMDKAKAMANLSGVENITNISIYEEYAPSPKKDYRDAKLRKYHEELEVCEYAE